jgi:hypothetical protein
MRRLSALLLLAAAACGGGDDLAGPSHAQIGGTWRITFTNMSGSGVTCSTSNGNMTLTHSGATAFTGSYGPITLTCTDGNETLSGTFSGVVVNGTVNVNTVAFDLDTQDVHQSGTVNGNSMSGSSQWDLDVGAGQSVRLNGNWSAAKQ